MSDGPDLFAQLDDDAAELCIDLLVTGANIRRDRMFAALLGRVTVPMADGSRRHIQDCTLNDLIGFLDRRRREGLWEP